MVRGLLTTEDFPSHKHPILHDLKKKKKADLLEYLLLLSFPLPHLLFFPTSREAQSPFFSEMAVSRSISTEKEHQLVGSSAGLGKY